MKIVKKLILFSLIIIVVLALVESRSHAKNLKKHKKNKTHKNVPNFQMPQATVRGRDMPCPIGYELNSYYRYLNCFAFEGKEWFTLPVWRGSLSTSYCCIKSESKIGTLNNCASIGLEKDHEYTWQTCPIVGGQPDGKGHFTYSPGYVVAGNKCCKHPDVKKERDGNCPTDSPINNWNFGISVSVNYKFKLVTSNVTVEEYRAWFNNQPDMTPNTPYWDYIHYVNCLGVNN